MRTCALGCTKVMHIQCILYTQLGFGHFYLLTVNRCLALCSKLVQETNMETPFVKLPSILNWAALLSFHHIGERKAG